MILAATNHPELLDKALYRRFDDIIEYEKPEQTQIKAIAENRLASFSTNSVNWDKISTIAEGLSAADITRACEDAAKEAVLHHDTQLSTEILLRTLERRKTTK